MATHCRSLSSRPSPVRIEGRATLTTGTSRTTRNCPAHAARITAQASGVRRAAAGAGASATAGPPAYVCDMTVMLAAGRRPATARSPRPGHHPAELGAPLDRLGVNPGCSPGPRASACLTVPLRVGLTDHPLPPVRVHAGTARPRAPRSRTRRPPSGRAPVAVRPPRAPPRPVRAPSRPRSRAAHPWSAAGRGPRRWHHPARARGRRVGNDERPAGPGGGVLAPATVPGRGHGGTAPPHRDPVRAPCGAVRTADRGP